MSAASAAASNDWVPDGAKSFAKINRPVLDVWIGILRSLPGARLVLQSPPGTHRDPVYALFRDEGDGTATGELTQLLKRGVGGHDRQQARLLQAGRIFPDPVAGLAEDRPGLRGVCSRQLDIAAGLGQPTSRQQRLPQLEWHRELA